MPALWLVVAAACGLAAHGQDAGNGGRPDASATAPLAAVSRNPGATGLDPKAAPLAAWLRTQGTVPVAGVGSLTQPSPNRSQRQAIDRLSASAAGPVEVRFRPGIGTAMLIKGPGLERRNRGAGLAGLDADEATARQFLRKNRELLGLDDPDAELRVSRRDRDDLGRVQVRFEQRYAGLPVWPCELTVHLDPAGEVDLLNATTVATPGTVSVQPALDREAAIAMARGAFVDEDPGLGDAELIVYAPLDAAPKLAWKVELVVGGLWPWRCVVEAQTGRLLARVKLVHDALVNGSGLDALNQTRPLRVWQEGSTYYLVDAGKPMFIPASRPPFNGRGVIMVFDAQNLQVIDPQQTVGLVKSSNPNSGWLADAVGAAYALSETYDYYAERHARNSLDGQGGDIRAIVRFGKNVANAFWFPSTKTMVFGERFTRGLDVAGHELTHGVIDNVGNGGVLEYHKQPGALNESLADIFGEMVEARTRGANDWLIGSDLDRPARNLKDPGSFPVGNTGRGYPEKMSEYFDLEDSEAGDNGGVHINSSIINHCFYLLAEGLEGAIGRTDAARIFYRTLTVHLQKQSQFIDARHGAIASAEALFGQGSVQARRTAEAFDRVEITDAPSSPEPAPIPSVGSPDSVLALRLDTGTGQYYLIRRESALGDPQEGRFINTLKFLAPRRVSVSGNGQLAVFVTYDNDLGLVNTDGTSPRVANQPGLVHSVAMSPDGRRYAFVLLDEFGQPDNQVTVVDLAAGSERTIRLYAPGTDGGKLDIVKFADAMDFMPNGETLVYDAFSELRGEGGQVFSAWTLFAIDLNTDAIRMLINLNEGLDFGNPSLGKVRPNLITYEVIAKSTGLSTIFTGDLTGNRTQSIAQVLPANSIGIPDYTGDDSAIVYAQGDGTVPSGFSLVRQPLAADGITPLGSPGVWLRNADVGVVYRRGNFTSSNAPPNVTITSPSPSQNFTPPANVSITASATDPDGSVARVEFYAGSTKLGEDLVAPYQWVWTNAPVGTHRLIARATDQVGASADSAPVSIVVGISDNTPPTVALTSPAPGASFQAPATINLVADASDPDGIAKVEFFEGQNKLGEDTSAPYTLTWNGVPAGNYTLTARATDNRGATATSAGVQVTVTGAGAGFTATHSAGAYTAPGTLVVSCEVSYPAGQPLLSLLWRPSLPATWTLAGATGDGSPETLAGEILFTGSLLSNPLRFQYTVNIPAGQTGPKDIGSAVEYQLTGMVNPATTVASPNPLRVDAPTFHQADYRDPRWTVDATEANRVLAYWRTGSYHIDPQGLDGFAPGGGSTTGPRHSADYRGPAWVIDSTEANRVLSYWRAGGYRVDSSGLDGYAPGRAPGLRWERAPVAATLRLSGDTAARAGGTLTLTAEFTAGAPVLGLLLRPQLPPGWTVTGVSGDGQPELQHGHILFLGGQLPDPVRVDCTVRTASDAAGPRQVGFEAEWFLGGEVNPLTTTAEPQVVQVEAPGLPDGLALRLVDLAPSGTARLMVQSPIDRTVEIQTSDDLQVWRRLRLVQVVRGEGSFTDPDAARSRQRFYRAVTSASPMTPVRPTKP